MSIAGGRGLPGAELGFPSPLEVALPRECEGWEELYPPHVLFAEDRRTFEQSRFWFHDTVHYAEPYYPFDAVCVDCTLAGFSQASARLFAVPTSLGLEHRILGGYVYLSPNSITDEATIAGRAELFTARGGHYYVHWSELDADWRAKVQAEIRELDALAVPELPDVEDEALVTEGRGIGSAHALLLAYDRLLEGFDRIGHYHFELVNLGYGAYLALYDLCRQSFADISDQAIAKMVSGIDVVALRPDDELRRLAEHAVELGLAEDIKSTRDEKELISGLADTGAGDRWLANYREAKDPWFSFSYGNGLYHHHRSWIDDPSLRDDRLVRDPASGWGGHPPPTRRSPRRARPDHRRVSSATTHGHSSGVRRAAQARPHGVPTHRGPQLLHRSLVSHRAVEQGAGVRHAAGRARLPG